MLRIDTIEDIERIKMNKLLPTVLIKELEQYYKELTESLTGKEDAWKTYNLEKDGPIIVLQPGTDDPEDLDEIGMPREQGGIFGAPIEFTNTIPLDGMEFFKTVMVLDNSFCLVIYSEVGKFGEELDACLTEYLAD